MKKILFIVILILILIAIGLGGYIFFINNDKITISFNTNSDITVDAIKIKKGDSINLPNIERSDYDFLGWYINDMKVDNNYQFDKSTILSAKWDKQEDLNYELIIYCDDSYKCYNEEFFVNQKVYGNQSPINKNNINKNIIKTKSSNASFFDTVSNYALYEDEQLKIYDLKEKRTIVKNLSNSANAKYLTITANYVLYKDDVLKIYDINEKKILDTKVNIDANLEDYRLYLNEDRNQVIGIGYIKNNYVEYYNVLKDKVLYSNKYKSDKLNTLSDLNQINDYYLSFHVNAYPDNDVLLLSCEEEKVLLTEKTNSGIINFNSYGRNGKYVYIMNYSTQDASNCFRVYSNNMKPLFEGKGFQTDNNDYKKYVNINDYVYILDGKVVKKFDYDGKLLWTSKEYNDPKGLINRLERSNKFDEYKMASNYIVYVKGDNLVIENIDDDKESSVITKWKKTMRVGLLSYYTKAEANISSKSSQTYEEGIYVSVTEYSEKEMSCDPATVIEYCYTSDKKIISYPSYTVPSCVAAKPLIYLYPEKEMDVEIKLGYSDLLTTSYPKYNGEWKVKAYPSGKLIDKNTGRSLYGLYWEGKNYSAKKTDEGFIVKGSEIAKFLEEKLEILGLTEREAEEFIIYWLPQMEHNKYNYIRFATKEEIDNYMPLEINPKPDTIIRILMEFMPLEEKIDVKEQKLTRVERRGFTAIEWGGSLINQRVVK